MTRIPKEEEEEVTVRKVTDRKSLVIDFKLWLRICANSCKNSMPL